MANTTPPVLTQGLRDKIIGEIQALSIPGVEANNVKKVGAFPQTKTSILVDVDDEYEMGDIASHIRMMVVTIYAIVYAPQDRNGDLLDTVTSYVENYCRDSHYWEAIAGYSQARNQQIIGSSKRVDMYGEDAYFIREYEMVVPFAKTGTIITPSVSRSH